MPVVLTTPIEVSKKLRHLSEMYARSAEQCESLQRVMNARVLDGERPVALSAEMDTILKGIFVALSRLSILVGYDNGIFSGTFIGGGGLIDVDFPIASTLPLRVQRLFSAGCPSSLSYFFVGYGQDDTFAMPDLTVNQGIRLISYPDEGPNWDIFADFSFGLGLGIKANDIIEIASCSKPVNNGRYTVLYNAAPKALLGTQTDWEAEKSLESSAHWGFSLDMDHDAGAKNIKYEHSAGSGSAQFNFTDAFVENGAYVVQFFVKWTSGSVDLTVTLENSTNDGAEWAFKKTIASADDSGWYSVVTNAPADAGLLITGESAGASVITIDNIDIYGFQGLVLATALSEQSNQDTRVQIIHTQANE